MKQFILEILFILFMFLGFLAYCRPLFSFLSFVTAFAIGFVIVLIEKRNEERIFHK